MTADTDLIELRKGHLKVYLGATPGAGKTYAIRRILETTHGRMQHIVFNVEDELDWIAQHFFAGGVMPSHNLMRQFPDLFAVEADWRWSGTHYQKTALHWLENYDRNIAAIRPVLKAVYGDKAVSVVNKRVKHYFYSHEVDFTTWSR